ncbi:MAG: hypothetical protein WCR46_10915 [Deltaproteobacteria bacterium]
MARYSSKARWESEPGLLLVFQPCRWTDFRQNLHHFQQFPCLIVTNQSSYESYLINQIRGAFGLKNTPIRMMFRERSSRNT